MNTAYERRTIARMERDLSHDARMKAVGPAVMVSACAGGTVAFVLFIAWAFLTWAGVL